jgi:hypothetical protein
LPNGADYAQCVSVPKTTNLDPGQYIIQAGLYNQDGDLLARTLPRLATIIAGSQIENAIAETAPPTSGDCSNGNVVIRDTCKAFSYLFIPTSTQIEYIKTQLLEGAETGGLIGGITTVTSGVQDTLLSLDPGTTEAAPDTTLSLATPIDFNGSGGIDLTFFDTNPTTNPLATPTKTALEDIKTWISVFLWISFGLYVAWRPFTLFRPL